MSKLIDRNLESLKVLAKAKRPLRRSILENERAELIDAIVEIVLNVLRPSNRPIPIVKLSKKQKKILRAYKTRTLDRLHSRKVSRKTKKRILLQRGGFLMTLLPPAIALLSSLLLK